MSAVEVKNLLTGETQVYTCSPKEAVIAAYAQSLHDFNTWEYSQRYGSLVTTGKFTVACGDFCAMLEVAEMVPGYRAQAGQIVMIGERRYRVIGVHNIPEVSPDYAQMLTVEGIRGSQFAAKVYYRDNGRTQFEIVILLHKGAKNHA